jgi:hypothetical protein
MTTQHKNLKNISGGSQNDALPTYIHKKIPKSRETVAPVRGWLKVVCLEREK